MRHTLHRSLSQVAAAFGLALTTAISLLPAQAHAMSCEVLESAPQADRDDPRVKQVVAMWQELYTPFLDMTGRSTALTVLHRDARVTDASGKTTPLKPTAHICPGAPPVVYVTWELVDKVLGDSPTYPRSFLAFALGHELGHRINDLRAEGSLLGVEERASYGTGYGVEELADKRAALLAASAGYPMGALADARIVSQFLATEHSLRPFVIDSREQLLMGTLASFDAYENLYQIGLAMSLAGEQALALRLLERADELIAGDGVPLPEVKALRAIALMNAAAPFAPWRRSIQSVGLPPLRCEALYPGRSALSDVTQRGALRASDDQEARFVEAEGQLKLAERLLDQAESYQLTPITLHSARACLAIYRGDARAAKAALKLVEEAAGGAKKMPPHVKASVAQAQALSALTHHVASTPAPLVSTGGGAKRWGASVKKLARQVKPHEEAAQAVSILQHYPKFSEAPPEAKRSEPIAACSARPAPPLDAPKLPALGEAQALGQCPAGWRLLHALPRAATTTSRLGVTTCAPDTSAASQPNSPASHADRFVHLTLPGTTSPPLAPINIALVMRAYTHTSPQRDALICGCQAALPRGTSAAGERAELLVCPARGVVNALMTTATDGLVSRIVIYEELN